MFYRAPLYDRNQGFFLSSGEALQQQQISDDYILLYVICNKPHSSLQVLVHTFLLSYVFEIPTNVSLNCLYISTLSLVVYLGHICMKFHLTNHFCLGQDLEPISVPSEWAINPKHTHLHTKSHL